MVIIRHHFTWIKSQDVKDGLWRLNVPVKAQQDKALDYLIHLESEGRYILTVWFPHCQIGTYGAALYKPVIDAAVAWRDKYIATFDPCYKRIKSLDRALLRHDGSND